MAGLLINSKMGVKFLNKKWLNMNVETADKKMKFWLHIGVDI